MRGIWSVREQKRQTASLYRELSDLSTDKNKLAEYLQAHAGQLAGTLNLRNPYNLVLTLFVPTAP